MSNGFPLIDSLLERWPAQSWKDVRIIVAVSGGADSVALLRAVTESGQCLRENVVVAHFNHQLRGEESDADAEFVRQLASELGLDFVLGHATSNAEHTSELTARNERHGFLEEVAGQQAARFIVTAHTADDQAETILFRILRGTGVQGLAGIPEFRPVNNLTTLVRPLLGVWRADVISFLRQLGQSYRTDQSNAQSDYTRNKIRNELLPLLASEFNPRVREALNRLGSSAAETTEEAFRSIEELQSRCLISRSEDGLLVNRTPLRNTSLLLTRELFVRLWNSQGWSVGGMSFDHWESIGQAVHSLDHAKTLILPGAIRLDCDGDQIRIVRSK